MLPSLEAHCTSKEQQNRILCGDGVSCLSEKKWKQKIFRQTEMAMMNNIKQVRKGWTIIFIAHNLSMIQQCDETLIVLDNSLAYLNYL
jgi:ABC-type polysaccharide/polyol phosphate transport system ATPase subunit